MGTDRLRALDAMTGDERWSASLDDGAIQSASVVEEGVADDHAVFVHTGDRLAGFTSSGERTVTASAPAAITEYFVSESVFVATDEAIYALDR